MRDGSESRKHDKRMSWVGTSDHDEMLRRGLTGKSKAGERAIKAQEVVYIKYSQISGCLAISFSSQYKIKVMIVVVCLSSIIICNKKERRYGKKSLWVNKSLWFV